MHKFLPIILLVLTLGLASCSPATPAVPAPTLTPAASATAEPASAQGNCTVVSLMPTPGPTEASLFPAPGPADWTQGPETASVTFLEYSDFQ